MNTTAEALRQRSFEFAVKTVKLSRYLSETKQAWVLARQVLKSGTSIGANIRESRFAQSKADFISKLSIALKEASETQYWLEIMFASGLLTKEQYDFLKPDADWIVGTLVNVIKASKRNMKSPEQDLKAHNGDFPFTGGPTVNSTLTSSPPVLKAALPPI